MAASLSLFPFFLPFCTPEHVSIQSLKYQVFTHNQMGETDSVSSKQPDVASRWSHITSPFPLLESMFYLDFT